MIDTLSQGLKNLVDKSLESVNSDSLHQLRPYYRVQIYKFCVDEGNANFNKAIVWLQILAAQHVSGIAAQILPPKYNAEWLLQLAKETVYKVTLTNLARTGVGEIWNKRANLKLEGASQELIAAYYAYDAAAQSLIWTIELPTFPDFDETNTDWDWLGSDIDAVMLAAAAFAGRNWDRPYSSTKAREFWQWWLTEAIPQAWELAQNSASPS